MTKEQLKCPVCEKRLIDTNKATISEAYKEGEYPPGWEPDYVTKCGNCKNQIGIKKIS